MNILFGTFGYEFKYTRAAAVLRDRRVTSWRTNRQRARNPAVFNPLASDDSSESSADEAPAGDDNMGGDI